MALLLKRAAQTHLSCPSRAGRKRSGAAVKKSSTRNATVYSAEEIMNSVIKKGLLWIKVGSDITSAHNVRSRDSGKYALLHSLSCFKRWRLASDVTLRVLLKVTDDAGGGSICWTGKPRDGGESRCALGSNQKGQERSAVVHKISKPTNGHRKFLL